MDAIMRADELEMLMLFEPYRIPLSATLEPSHAPLAVHTARSTLAKAKSFVHAGAARPRADSGFEYGASTRRQKQPLLVAAGASTTLAAALPGAITAATTRTMDSVEAAARSPVAQSTACDPTTAPHGSLAVVAPAPCYAAAYAPRAGSNCADSSPTVVAAISMTTLEEFRHALCSRLSGTQLAHQSSAYSALPDREELKLWQRCVLNISSKLAAGRLSAEDDLLDIFMLMKSFGFLMRSNQSPPVCMCCLRPEPEIITSHFWPSALLKLCSLWFYRIGKPQLSGASAIAWKAFCNSRKKADRLSIGSDLQHIPPCESLFGEDGGVYFIRELLLLLERTSHDDVPDLSYNSGVFRMFMSIALRIFIFEAGNCGSKTTFMFQQFSETGNMSILESFMRETDFLTIATFYLRLRHFVVNNVDEDCSDLRLYMLSSARAHGKERCFEEQPIGHCIKVFENGAPYVHMWIRGLHFIATTSHFPIDALRMDWHCLTCIFPAGGRIPLKTIRIMSKSVLQSVVLLNHVHVDNKAKQFALSTASLDRERQRISGGSTQPTYSISLKLEGTLSLLPTVIDNDAPIAFQFGSTMQHDRVVAIPTLIRICDERKEHHAPLHFGGYTCRSWLLLNIRSKTTKNIIVFCLAGGSLRLATAWKFRTEPDTAPRVITSIAPYCGDPCSLSIPLSAWTSLVTFAATEFG